MQGTGRQKDKGLNCKRTGRKVVAYEAVEQVLELE